MTYTVSGGAFNSAHSPVETCITYAPPNHATSWTDIARPCDKTRLLWTQEIYVHELQYLVIPVYSDHVIATYNILHILQKSAYTFLRT